MNAIHTLKRSLVLSGVALVLAVPAAQAHPIAWAQSSGTGAGHHALADVSTTTVSQAPNLSTLNQVTVSSAAPVTQAAGSHLVRYGQSAGLNPRAVVLSNSANSTNWTRSRSAAWSSRSCSR